MADDNAPTGGPEPGSDDPDPKEPAAPEKLPDDHPAAIALRKANREAADARKKLKELEDAGKSELERAQQRASEAEYSAQEAQTRLLRYEVGGAKGLKPSQAQRLHGTTREELEADADKLLDDFGIASDPKPKEGDEPKPKEPARGPKETLRSGARPNDEHEPDMREVIAKIPRRI